MPMTDEELFAAKFPLEERGYCAHKLLKFRSCVAANAPWYINCNHEKHDYLHCQAEE